LSVNGLQYGIFIGDSFGGTREESLIDPPSKPSGRTSGPVTKPTKELGPSEPVWRERIYDLSGKMKGLSSGLQTTEPEK